MNFPPWQCLGPSMLPTFNMSGDVVLLEHLSTSLLYIKPGDVVVARSPTNPRLIVCKRVLGLEGDRVKVVPTAPLDVARTIKVPRGHVWLQGDNLHNSTDSRHYGPVPYAMLRGKVFFKVKNTRGMKLEGEA